MHYDLSGKIFRATSNSPNGAANDQTLFFYQQTGDLVTADYYGGGILSGHLIAKVSSNGQLDMRYHHVNSAGDLQFGVCVSTPELLPSGRLRFYEKWRWLSGDGSSGDSVIEETEPAPHSARDYT